MAGSSDYISETSGPLISVERLDLRPTPISGSASATPLSIYLLYLVIALAPPCNNKSLMHHHKLNLHH